MSNGQGCSNDSERRISPLQSNSLKSMVDIDMLELKEHQEWVSGLEILKNFPCSRYTESPTTDSDYDLLDVPEDIPTINTHSMPYDGGIVDFYCSQSHPVSTMRVASCSSIHGSYHNSLKSDSSCSDITLMSTLQHSYVSQQQQYQHQHHHQQYHQHQHQNQSNQQPLNHLQERNYASHNIFVGIDPSDAFPSTSSLSNHAAPPALYPLYTPYEETRHSSGHTSSASSPSPFGNNYSYNYCHSSSHANEHRYHQDMDPSLERHHTNSHKPQSRINYNRPSFSMHKASTQRRASSYHLRVPFQQIQQTSNNATARKSHNLIKPHAQSCSRAKQISNDHLEHEDGNLLNGDASDSEQSEGEFEVDESNHDTSSQPRRKASENARKILLTWLVLHQSKLNVNAAILFAYICNMCGLVYYMYLR